MAGEVKNKKISIALDDGDLVTLAVRFEAVDPRAAVVLDYLEAFEVQDSERIHGLLAEDFRMNAEGDRSRLDAWNAWDWELHTVAHVEDLTITDEGVAVALAESSDFHRLLDRPFERVRLAFEFDDEHRISSIATSRTGDEEGRERFEKCLAWARENRPEKLQEVYGTGAIVPGLEQARAWRELIGTWRKSRMR